MPNFRDYHESVTSELDAVKNRIRNLVTHWLTDGEWKEAALRTVLRRHLPGGTLVGRGFIVGRDHSIAHLFRVGAIGDIAQAGSGSLLTQSGTQSIQQGVGQSPGQASQRIINKFLNKGTSTLEL